MESGKTVGTGFEIGEFQVYFAPVSSRETLTTRFYEGGVKKKCGVRDAFFFFSSLLDDLFVFVSLFCLPHRASSWIPKQTPQP